MAAIALLMAGTAFADSKPTPPWNLEQLFKAPSFEWADQKSPVHALFYTGELFQGKPSRIFAYYATPDTLAGAPTKAGTKYPGIVLIHGGGGTAFKEWATLWARRGYAAIAMDLAGVRPDEADNKNRTPIPQGGPGQDHVAKFDTIKTEDFTDDWNYHAVANGILAHSLLRSFPEVDADRTAVTGISWGGYTTCIVASLDDRFKAAVPVYGCGFLNQNSSWLPEFEKLSPDYTKKWVKFYDPGSWLPQCRVPIFFVNGTNDVHYRLNSYIKSYDAVKLTPKNIRIQVKMSHGHQPGWAPMEIGLFVDSLLGVRSEKPLQSCDLPESAGDNVKASVRSSTVLKTATLSYAKPGNTFHTREWETVPATIENGIVTAPAPPPDSDMWFFNITDERGAMISSPVRFLARW
ncbi:prolyl oligopeptidase family protein [Roseimicrobium gellanilyticum]|uniref:Prolyl oligopeptidase family protein n=2 Tax=Roseimicrobium gellanilyticum TaxID=748857 RepID=A0A366HUP2_9BACT|nr:prolyl oligopeptidase family protein [Roseimicrobium gellanilyticum]